MNSMIKLFKALPLKDRTAKNTKEPTFILLRASMERGIIFTPEVIANHSEEYLLQILNDAGPTFDALNASFHKSWNKVATAPLKKLVMEQLIHYMTTYGFKKEGIFSHDSVYIPAEELDVPDLKEKSFLFIIIKGLTKKEVKQKLLDLLQTNIALNEETIKNIVDVADYVKLTKKDVKIVKNKESKIILQDKLGIIPSDPVEFLRLAIYKTTEETLLIKNKYLIEKIKSGDSFNTSLLFKKYHKENGIEKLSSIFYRFKPIFLAFKKTSNMKKTINRIRRLAVTNHKPFKENYINSVTKNMANGTLEKEEFEKQLTKVPIFRKIKLAYALKYRTKDADSIVYKIRNGKGYAKEFNFTKKKLAEETYNIVENSIVNDLIPSVKGKKIYIPDFIEYALPATEKQFVGNFPAGTCVTIDKDMIFGVHWNNVETNMIDLDLSVINMEGTKFGWDGSYRDEGRTVLFSGDITNAPGKNGASELFYIKHQEPTNMILNINYYNHDPEIPVPYQIVIGKESVENLKNNYMIDPNNIVVQSESKISQRQMFSGLITVTEEGSKFYFVESAIGNSISTGNSECTNQSREYLFNYYTDTITLNDILEKAGAKLVNIKEKCDIDLSPEAIDKTTLINLLRK